MIIIKPYYEIELVDPEAILRKLEKAGRTCYKSEDKITPDSATKFIRSFIKKGHESILEHVSITVRVICNRGVSHEWVRHRIASYSQESTRFCNYSGGITFILPPWVKLWDGFELNKEQPLHHEGGFFILDDKEKLTSSPLSFDEASEIWLTSLFYDEQSYKKLLTFGWTPEKARGILPIDLKTEIVCTHNLRTWRHIFRLRALGTTGKPHPQMLELMVPMLKDFKQLLPVIFEDLKDG